MMSDAWHEDGTSQNWKMNILVASSSRRSFPPYLSCRILSSSYTTSPVRSSLISYSPIFCLWLVLWLQLGKIRTRESAYRGVWWREHWEWPGNILWAFHPTLLWECWGSTCLLQPLLYVGSGDPNSGLHTWLASATELSPQPRPCLTKTTRRGPMA